MSSTNAFKHNMISERIYYIFTSLKYTILSYIVYRVIMYSSLT